MEEPSLKDLRQEKKEHLHKITRVPEVPTVAHRKRYLSESNSWTQEKLIKTSCSICSGTRHPFFQERKDRDLFFRVNKNSVT